MQFLPNILSLSRILFALLFVFSGTALRLVAIVLALISDGLDGYVARKYRVTSKSGTIIDPLTDKFFVITVLVMFLMEKQLTLLGAAAFLSRDAAVLLFGIYLTVTGKLACYEFRAIWCGKVMTILQFLVLIGLTLQLTVPSFVYSIFLILGFLSFVELYLTQSEVEKI